MASDVQVTVTDRTVIQALNTPGGLVFDWRDEVAAETIRIAEAMSPVNNVLNARHRAGWTGEYKQSWGFDRMGSNGHTVRATIYNGANHADIVEYGRSASSRPETFSWTGHSPPGSVSMHRRGTGSRVGKHILANSVNMAMAAQGINAGVM
jgi:hypothetical protein